MTIKGEIEIQRSNRIFGYLVTSNRRFVLSYQNHFPRLGPKGRALGGKHEPTVSDNHNYDSCSLACTVSIVIASHYKTLCSSIVPVHTVLPFKWPFEARPCVLSLKLPLPNAAIRSSSRLESPEFRVCAFPISSLALSEGSWCRPKRCFTCRIYRSLMASWETIRYITEFQKPISGRVSPAATVMPYDTLLGWAREETLWIEAGTWIFWVWIE